MRRKVKNTTGIERLPNINTNNVWVAYTCVNCHEHNLVDIGKNLITPSQAYSSHRWKCKRCGFIHSKDSDLPMEWANTWKEYYLSSDSPECQRFWKSFFTIATEKPESFWKQCNVCGRILPSTAFGRHKGWGVLQKQMECRACKGSINAVLNDKRTSEQLRESSLRRRIGDLFTPKTEKLDVAALFKRFDSKCFKTGARLDINKPEQWHIDHILPSKYFYPLTSENACLLSAEANENKKALWPSHFYNDEELVRLAKITGADLELLTSPFPIINKKIDVNAALEKWITVRNDSDINKRLKEFRKVIIANGLEDMLSENNKKLLGLGA